MAKGVQYSIRGVSEEVDRALRHEAKARRLSLNAYILSELERIVEQQFDGKKYHDLDFLIGSMPDGKEIDVALEDFGRIDEEMWK